VIILVLGLNMVNYQRNNLLGTEPWTLPRDTRPLRAVLRRPLWGGRGVSARADDLTSQHRRWVCWRSGACVPAGSVRSSIVITAPCSTTWRYSGRVARWRNRGCSVNPTPFSRRAGLTGPVLAESGLITDHHMVAVAWTPAFIPLRTGLPRDDASPAAGCTGSPLKWHGSRAAQMGWRRRLTVAHDETT